MQPLGGSGKGADPSRSRGQSGGGFPGFLCHAISIAAARTSRATRKDKAASAAIASSAATEAQACAIHAASAKVAGFCAHLLVSEAPQPSQQSNEQRAATAARASTAAAAAAAAANARTELKPHSDQAGKHGLTGFVSAAEAVPTYRIWHTFGKIYGSAV